MLLFYQHAACNDQSMPLGIDSQIWQLEVELACPAVVQAEGTVAGTDSIYDWHLGGSTIMMYQRTLQFPLPLYSIPLLYKPHEDENFFIGLFCSLLNPQVLS